MVIHVYDDSSDSGVTNPPDLGPDMAVRFTSIKLDICLEGMDEESEEVPGVAIPDGSVHTNAPRSMLTLESTRILGLPGMLILNWDSSAIKLYATPEGEDEVTSYAVPWSHFPGAVFFAEGFAPTHAAMRCFASLAPTCHDWLQAVVLQVGITFADPDDPTWSELAERKVILSDDETRLKISIRPQQDSFENVLALLGADVVLSSSATAPAGIVLEMNADNTCFYQESVGSVLKIALTQDQLRNMGLLPEQPQDLLQEKAWYDTGFDVTVNSPNLLDGREFDRMVPFESRGQCTRAIYGGLEATPPNSPLDRTFFQAAGREILAASYWWSASPLRQLMNQADVFYYSGHGYHSPGNLEAGSANDVSPYWTNDLDIAIFAGCSVLDINDYNNNFTNQTDHLLSPGKTWASVGPDVMLGYNYTAPTDMQGSDMIILNWASNHSNGEDAITAWKNANDNSHGRNACAIQEGAGYYYFHKTPGLLFNTYTWTFIPESEW